MKFDVDFSLDIGKTVQDMIKASTTALVKGGIEATELATHEYAQFITDIAHVQTMADNKNNFKKNSPGTCRTA